MTKFTLTDEVLTCFFAARLDTVVCKDLEITLSEKMASAPGAVVFNMGQVEYISSAFLRICIMTAKRSSTGVFSITDVSPAVKKVFKMAKLDEVLNVQS